MLNGRGNILFTYIKDCCVMGHKDSRKWSTDKLNGLTSSYTGIRNMQFITQVPKFPKNLLPPTLKMRAAGSSKNLLLIKQQDARSQRITVTTLRTSRALFTWSTLVKSPHFGINITSEMK
jgi:hypothetical protein